MSERLDVKGRLRDARGMRGDLGWPPKDPKEYARLDAIVVALTCLNEIENMKLRIKQERERFRSAMQQRRATK